MSRRPLSLSLTAVLFMFIGLVELITNVSHLLNKAPIDSASDNLVAIFLWVGIPLALASLFIAWGVWNLQRWAFGASFAVLFSAICIHGLELLTGFTIASTFSTLIQVIIMIVLLAYLFTDDDAYHAFRDPQAG